MGKSFVDDKCCHAEHRKKHPVMKMIRFTAKMKHEVWGEFNIAKLNFWQLGISFQWMRNMQRNEVSNKTRCDKKDCCIHRIRT